MTDEGSITSADTIEPPDDMVTDPNTQGSGISNGRGSSGEVVLDLHHAAKTYKGGIRALDGVSLQVRKGEVFGLLGPNGAGKSTLVKMLMTVVRPTKVEGTMLGHAIGEKASLVRVGYLPEQHRFPQYLTGRQVLDYYAALSNVPRKERKKQMDRLLDVVDMGKWGRKCVAQYSKGMRQRLGLAQALMNDPEIVFLDEPTDGVDPVGRRDIRTILRQLSDQGTTVFLNSHLLGEVEMVCDRVCILLGGRVVREGDISDLAAESVRYEIDFAGPPPGWVNQMDNVQVSRPIEHNTRLQLPGRGAEDVQSVIDRLRAESLTISRVEEKHDSLEDLFIQAVDANAEGSTTGAPDRKRRKSKRSEAIAQANTNDGGAA